MDHRAHEPGTVEECPECRAASYEPGWYRALLAEHEPKRSRYVIPEAAGAEILVPEADLTDVVVPDLEDALTDDDDR